MSNDIYHESIGVLKVGKCSSNFSMPFVGSELLHNQYIELELHTGSVNHKETQTYIHPHNVITSVRLTLTQWAEFVSSIGNGSGTPCTITRIPIYDKLKRCEAPAIPSKFEYRNGVQIDEFKKMSTSLDAIQNTIDNSKLSKTHKDEIASKIHMMKLTINENFDYFRQVMREDMEDIVSDAKKNLESYAERLGINKDTMPQLGSSVNLIE